MINIGMPSTILKMLRQKFDQQWSTRKTQSSADEQGRLLRLLKPASLQLDVRLQGPSLAARDLTQLEVGDVLQLDYDLARPVDLLVNGVLKYRGHVVAAGRRRAFVVEQPFRPPE
jgi:flagellar motor switch protein FliM